MDVAAVNHLEKTLGYLNSMISNCAYVVDDAKVVDRSGHVIGSVHVKRDRQGGATGYDFTPYTEDAPRET